MINTNIIFTIKYLVRINFHTGKESGNGIFKISNFNILLVENKYHIGLAFKAYKKKVKGKKS